jgi:hypothetical protein
VRLWGGGNHFDLIINAIKADIDREIQLFLLGYVIISICEIFTVGAFPLADNVRKVSTIFEDCMRPCLS